MDINTCSTIAGQTTLIIKTAIVGIILQVVLIVLQWKEIKEKLKKK